MLFCVCSARKSLHLLCQLDLCVCCLVYREDIWVLLLVLKYAAMQGCSFETLSNLYRPCECLSSCMARRVITSKHKCYPCRWTQSQQLALCLLLCLFVMCYTVYIAKQRCSCLRVAVLPLTQRLSLSLVLTELQQRAHKTALFAFSTKQQLSSFRCHQALKQEHLLHSKT